ncbi:hypothetical protein [Micromonospora sp. DT227]|uniref:hypothetical protein n=1 Tax=Micromonospora sp. DT227 TaxID=3393433 RepID=UPI003CEF8322
METPVASTTTPTPQSLLADLDIVNDALWLLVDGSDGDGWNRDGLAYLREHDLPADTTRQQVEDRHDAAITRLRDYMLGLR